MEAYRCAYRDSKSPLTPLTPLTTNVFDFDKLTPTNRVKSASFLTPNYKTVTKSPSVRRAGSNSKPLLLVNAKLAANKGLSLSATKSKPTAIATRLTPTATKLKSTATKLTPTATKLTPIAIRLAPVAARLTPASSNNRSAQTTTSTSTKKNIERIHYSNGATVVTKYREYTVKETSTTTTSKYEVSPRACLQLNPTAIKQASIYRAPASPMISKGPCPRVVDILNEIGMAKYLKIFEAEEIDYDVFRMMTEDDLHGIGITSQLDRDIILNAVQYWSDFY